MRQAKQELISTKEEKEGQEKFKPIKKYHDIYVRVEKYKNTVYTEQAGNLPVT